MNMKNIMMAMMMFALMALLVACGTDDKEETPDTSADTPETSEEETDVDVDTEETDTDTDSSEVEVTHELDNEPVLVPKNPETVAVFDFGILDTMMELDVEVAGLPQSNIPAYLDQYTDEQYTNLGSLKEPDFEALNAMNPDVIFISSRQADLYEEFSKIAPTVYIGLDYSDYMVSFKHNMELVADIFDKEDEMAAELTEIDEQIAAIHEKTSEIEDQALIVLATEGKVSAYGPSSRFGIIHDVFGFKAADENIEASTHGQNITFEYILKTNPDVLFIIDRDAAIGNGATAKDSVENDLVMKTSAFENEKMIYLNGEYWYLSGGGLLSMKEMVKEVESAL